MFSYWPAVTAEAAAHIHRLASLTAIAADLNMRQAPTARGGKWYPATVRYILTNGFYAGLIQYDGEEVVEEEGEHDPIITTMMYEDAQRRLISLKPGPIPADL